MIEEVMNNRIDALDDDEADRSPPSPFDDDAGPLTWRIFAWRAALILVLTVISLLLLLGGSMLVMWMYGR
jgi:hypothetical protein